MAAPEDWIVSTGVRPVYDNLADLVVPDQVLSDPSRSLIAKGLFTLLLTEQGANPSITTTRPTRTRMISLRRSTSL